jgi:hypothetical protein
MGGMSKLSQLHQKQPSLSLSSVAALDASKMTTKAKESSSSTPQQAAAAATRAVEAEAADHDHSHEMEIQARKVHLWPSYSQ